VRALRILSALATASFPAIAAGGHPVLITGDLNEDFHPQRLLREAGYRDCYGMLGVPAPHTHPARPSHPKEEGRPDRWGALLISAGCCSVRGGGPRVVAVDERAVQLYLRTGVRVARMACAQTSA
jgi:hypothetical protein